MTRDQLDELADRLTDDVHETCTPMAENLDAAFTVFLEGILWTMKHLPPHLREHVAERIADKVRTFPEVLAGPGLQ